MTGKDQVVTTRPLVRGSVLPRRAGRRPLRVRFGRRPPARVTPQPGSRLLVLVPAHDAEATVARTLASLRAQTRRPDRVVVLADDCTDATEEVARRFPEVTVMRTVENVAGRAGALGQGWRRWRAGHDLVAVVDADTVLAPDCLEQLASDLAAAPSPGAVTVRFGVDQALGSDAVARLLVRRHRAETTAWTTSALQGDRSGYATGGQVALHDAGTLRDLVGDRGTPWTGTDDQLVRALRRAGHHPAGSPGARAHTGPVLTLRSLAARRLATAENTARALRSRFRRSAAAGLLRPQLALLAGLAVRVLVLGALVGVLPSGPWSWSWSWSWSLLLLVAAVAGTVRAMRAPHRTAADVLAGVLLLPAEVDFWMRLGCAAVGWVRVLRPTRRPTP